MSAYETRTREAVMQALKALAPEADLDRLDLNQSLREQLDLDSFDFLQLLIGLQEAVGVSVPERDYRQVDSLHGLMDYLDTHRPPTDASKPK